MVAAELGLPLLRDIVQCNARALSIIAELEGHVIRPPRVSFYQHPGFSAGAAMRATAPSSSSASWAALGIFSQEAGRAIVAGAAFSNAGVLGDFAAQLSCGRAGPGRCGALA